MELVDSKTFSAHFLLSLNYSSNNRIISLNQLSHYAIGWLSIGSCERKTSSERNETNLQRFPRCDRCSPIKNFIIMISTLCKRCRTSCCEKVKVRCCVNSPTIDEDSIEFGLAWLHAEFFFDFLTNSNQQRALSDSKNNWNFALVIGNILRMCSKCIGDGDDREKERVFLLLFPFISPSPHFLMTLDSFRYHHHVLTTECNFHTPSKCS